MINNTAPLRKEDCLSFINIFHTANCNAHYLYINESKEFASSPNRNSRTLKTKKIAKIACQVYEALQSEQNTAGYLNRLEGTLNYFLRRIDNSKPCFGLPIKLFGCTSPEEKKILDLIDKIASEKEKKTL